MGGGVGGLALSRALASQAIPSVVLDRRHESEHAGAGLGLGSNGVLALRHLGVSLEGSSQVSPIRGVQFQNHRGRVLKSVNLERISNAIGAPSIALPRAVLHDALRPRGSLARIRDGIEVVGLRREAEGWTVLLDGGDEVRSELVVGADGAHSIVRGQLGLGAMPVYQGYTAWQAIVPRELTDEGTSVLAIGEGSEFGFAPAGDGLVYWYATLPGPELPYRNLPDPRPLLATKFRHWAAPVGDLIEATERKMIVTTPIHFLPPIPRWSNSGAVLLGDAAHPITPHLGQGASLALEDAAVLGRLLPRAESLNTILNMYERARKERTSRISRQSARLGRLLHWTNPLGRFARTLGLSLTPGSYYEHVAHRMMRYDARTVPLG